MPTHVQAQMVYENLTKMFNRQLYRNYKMRPKYTRRFYHKSLLLNLANSTSSSTRLVPNASTDLRDLIVSQTHSSNPGGSDLACSTFISRNESTRSRRASLNQTAAEADLINVNNNSNDSAGSQKRYDVELSGLSFNKLALFDGALRGSCVSVKTRSNTSTINSVSCIDDDLLDFAPSPQSSTCDLTGMQIFF